MTRTLFTCAALLLAATVHAGEMSAAENEVWDTLNAQLDLSIYGKYQEASDRYVHPELTAWGPQQPVPGGRTAAGIRFLEQQRAHSGATTLAHTVTPITVKVVGNTAVINALLVLLVKPSEDAEPEQRQFILHNTWVKEGGDWRLLATYNTRTN